MKSNVGGLDRVLRIVIGLTLIGLATSRGVGTWGYLGFLPLLMGLAGWCPPYAFFGGNTCSIKNKA